MRTKARNVLVLAALAGLGWLAACSGLDSGKSADVVLQIAALAPTPVTSAPSSADPSVCAFTVASWGLTLNNKPKSDLAITSPYNDIVLESMTLSYQWNNSGIVTPDWSVPITGLVPANGSAEVSFYPIALDELTPAMAGNSAAMTMIVTGRSNSGTGDRVTAFSGTTLAVNSCQLQPIVGACCGGIPISCQLLTPFDCTGGGGTYLGDRTTCALNPCGGP